MYERESRVPSNTPLGYLKKNENKFSLFFKNLPTFTEFIYSINLKNLTR